MAPSFAHSSSGQVAGVAEQEPGGEQVAGAGGVEHLLDRLGGRVQHLVAW